ncbi:MAG: Sialidase precursor [Verrucomicrobiota bacterium]|jgi:sialidase-1|nr:glycoside hydrolase [Opitutaceae bacterium]
MHHPARSVFAAAALALLCPAPGPAATRGAAAEGALAPFLGAPVIDRQMVFSGKDRIREPYLAVALDGTIVVLRNYDSLARRSEDGGRTWSEPSPIPVAFLDSNFIVDEVTGDLLSLRLWDGRDRLWRSQNQGRTWSEQAIALMPNEVMKWMERTGLKRRGVWADKDAPGVFILHNNASEPGITLRHGPRRGRLIVTGTFRPLAKEHPSDRKPADGIYSCAVYSDDRGATWRVSGLFPESATEEAALVELSDGTLYFNSRCCDGFYNKALARPLGPDESRRREAWSRDGGETWEGLRVNPVLADGGGYDRGYGLKAGLTRLPVAGRDILIFSNTDTAGGPREKLTLWASFDGGRSWPVKRLVNPGHSAYSSLATGRPGTPGEGSVYLLFEGGPDGKYTAMHFVRLNLSWILQGERTGEGTVPEWVK